MTKPKTNPTTDLPRSLFGRRSNEDKLPLNYEATIANVRSAILKELDEGETITTAVTVALVDNQRILWAEAFGSIDRPRGLVADTESLFCIASCSKVIAATAVMILVDRGLIALDVPLARYMSELRMAEGEQYRDITVRMLLNHSSGLHGSHFCNIITISPVYDYAVQFRDSLADKRLKHEPGEMSIYCNDGYTLIELLVSAVTGQCFTDFVKKEILEPLGMDHSCFALEPFQPGSLATGLDSAGRPDPQEYINVYASGLFSTPSDMGRFAMMLLNGGCLGNRRILTTEAVAEMGRDQTLDLPFNPITGHFAHFGLGWDGVREGGLAAVGVKAWYKCGDADHYHSCLIVAPDEQLAAVVILVNGVEMGSVAPILAERIMLQALAERESITHVPAPLKSIAEPATAKDEDLASIAGIYASSYGPRRLDVQADRTLTLSIFTKGQWRPFIEGLKMRWDGFFIADNHPEVAYRMVRAGGRRYLVARRRSGLGHYEMELPDSHDMPTARPLSAKWQARLGQRWLIVNDLYSAFLALGRQKPLFSLGEVEGLEGYIAALVLTAGLDLVQIVDPQENDNLARMCLKIPLDNGWGLNDLVIENRDGEEWVIWGSLRYRPLTTVTSLKYGRSTVTINMEGLGEWLRLPTSSSLTLSGADIWYVYNAEFTLLDWGMKDRAIGAVADSSYLLVHSAQGTTITVTAEP
ncbi:MAG: beta-lactamase family protein [Deltaproteobacteria bacterium]|nr:beta-lactamase family protein [Deltaproteobacteria bacterium]